jgi:hypothetical protein
MKILIFVFGILTLFFEIFGTLFDLSAGGYPKNWLVLTPIAILVLLSLIGIIGMVKYFKARTFWLFSLVGIGIPLLWWVYEMWPSGGIIKFFS